MAGSSSDPAVTGPAAFAAVQEYNREDTINKQAKEIQALKRRVEQMQTEVTWYKWSSNQIIGDINDHKRACYDLKQVMQDCNRQIREELDKVAKERGYEYPQNWPSEASALEQLRNLFANGPGSMEETMEELAPSEDESEEEEEAE